MKTCKRCLTAMFHPASTFNDMWERRDYGYSSSFVILAVLIVVKVLERQLTGFVFNYNDPDELNVLIIFAAVAGGFALWVVMNWMLSTLFEGKAHMRDIWLFSSWCLQPYILCSVLGTILSNVLVTDEGIFLTWINAIGIIWSIGMLFIALIIIHDYSFGKVLWSSLATVAGIAIILFLAVLCFSLCQQIFGFISDIFSEIGYRLL